jgi:hypothetical protein
MYMYIHAALASEGTTRFVASNSARKGEKSFLLHLRNPLVIHSIANMRRWHQAQPSKKKMGGRLSRAGIRFPWAGNKQHNDRDALFSRLRSQGFFNLKLTPTQEESCTDDDDHDWSPTVYFDSEEDDDDDDESMLYGQRLRSDPRHRVYHESSPALENRRPALYRALFG